VEDERYALGVVVGVHVDPGTADNLTHGAPRQNLGLDDSRRKVHDEQTCPIDDALCRVYVLQQAVAETGISNRAMWKSSVIPTDLEVVQDIAVGGGINVANSLTSNVLRVGTVSGKHVDMSNVAIQFSSSSKVDASLTATGALSNGGNGTAELVVNAKDYTYEGSMFNNGSDSSTGVVRVQSYLQYPPLPAGRQSISTYGISQRFWSGKISKNNGNYLLQCYGNGSYGLYGTYTVQFMTKSGDTYQCHVIFFS